ncbi:MAG: methionyl-tRNA formyltransferase [Anaerolineaceae bacterium]|nr:methionyl-tRNA formyltransferase [Anaerolineaceae bacterium]
MNVKIVFMGSPEFALPSLSGLIKNYDVIGVVTQPDRPAGRGKKLLSPPVKDLALEHRIPVIQPRRLKEEIALEQLTQWNPDLIVVVAFGQILKQNVLDMPKYGCINVHASLLPRWRGAAPIQASVYHGDTESGVTIMKMDAGIDTGPILRQKKVNLRENETAVSLGNRLSQLGAELLIDTLPGYLRGEIIPQPQPENGATYVSMIDKWDGLLDFSRPAFALINQIRAYNPWPGTFFDIQNERLKIHEAELDFSDKLAVGERGVVNGYPVIGTSEGNLLIRVIQPSGKKPMPGDVFLRGFRVW